ncbi:LAMI_0H02894g1_1 [Lachancea mirantina]|uniref:t-SNARE affecting a late Golgi compartment protein 1 n=1 Tax=Lachancea mirantina TaxID=1230905 RepID=A0A1G4KEF1_9SACH|nr:LAMI_0H02894g1_1 [Lachancea mirantina]
MSIPGTSDPFDQVLHDTGDQTSRLLQYLDHGHELDDEIKDIIRDVDETVQELDRSIVVMRKSAQLDERTIGNREASVDALKREVARLKALAARNASTKSSRPAEDLDLEQDAAGDEEGGGDHDLVQQELLREQDVHLDSIQNTMQNLHLQATTMGQELEDQGVILEEMDTGVDNVVSKLARGRRQLEWVYEKNKERYNDCCIGLLIVVLIVLLVLAFVL